MTALTQVMDRIGGGPRLGMVLVAVASFAVIWGFAQWGLEPRYVPIATRLSVERIGEATERLTEAGIDYRLERGGEMLTVPDRDAARARVALAAEGLTGDREAPGFELFDQSSWGMTEFTQRVNYRRALEGELERTMNRMRGVERASVHLALRERSFLRGSDQAAEASVVLRLTDASEPHESVVRGVQSLVASAVEGLAAENVSVLDDRGRLLSERDADGTLGLTSAQIEVQRQLEQYLEGKAAAIAAQIVGPDNATIRVAADLNFDQVSRTVQAVDPNQSALVAEDRAEITPGDARQGAASLQVTTEFESTRSVETLARTGARVERLSVAVVVGDRRIENPDGTTTLQPRSDEELARIRAAVANAVGLFEARGDQISVMSAPLDAAGPALLATDERPLDYEGLVMAAGRPLIVLTALAIALFVALRVLSTLREAAAAARVGPGAELRLAGPEAGRIGPSTAPAEETGRAGTEERPAPPPVLPRVELEDPEMTVKVLRSWMREG